MSDWKAVRQAAERSAAQGATLAYLVAFTALAVVLSGLLY